MPGRLHPFLTQLPLAYLRAHGGVPGELDEEALASPDGVPVLVQRRLLEAVAARGGDGALLDLAAQLPAVADQPLLFVMLNARSVADLLDKEQRFNRFFHSHHRVRIHELAEGHVVLEHHGADDTPARVESLFVLGLHLVLFEQIGCSGLSVRFVDSEQPERAVTGPPYPAPPAGKVMCWRIAWDAFTARREPMVGLDELLLQQASPRDLSADESLPARLRRLVSQDLAHRWTVAEVAAGLHTSSRSLQRELSSADTTFSRELERARVDMAMRLLADPAHSVTEVGYVCGFSDGAHFSRRFKAVVGEAPVTWRKQRA